jgi:hypothetical protein
MSHPLGADRKYEVDDSAVVTGTIALDQSQFGIVPLSILGGAIAAQDQVNLRFEIRGRRVADLGS